MFYVIRLLLLLIIVCNFTILSASTYNNDIINIFSKILPRIVLMSSKKNDLHESINICILYDKIDKKAVESFIEQTNRNYPRGIKNYQIKVTKANYKNSEKCKNTTIAFLLNSNNQNIQETLKYFHINKILTSSYNSNLLQYGTDISMFLGKKTVPYINMKSIQKKEIELKNTLIRISKIYNGGLK